MKDLITNTLVEFGKDCESYTMKRPKDAMYASPPNSESECSHVHSSEEQLECCVNSRMSQAISLFLEAGLLRRPDARKSLSIERMSVLLEAGINGLGHECEGRRNCPLRFLLDKTLAALRQPPLQTDECLRGSGASVWKLSFWAVPRTL